MISSPQRQHASLSASGIDWSALGVLLDKAEDKADSRPTLAPLFAAASALLVEIAGDEPQHIEMNPVPGQKYGPVRRPFGLEDARAHLSGKSTRGARIRRADGRTRALCVDGDNADEWRRLEDGSQLLLCAGYRCLLEPAPACSLHPGGGHLWIVYDGLVDARCAWRHVCEIAPMLAQDLEYWPASKQNIRLPGGVYVTPGLRLQCQLYDAIGGLVATSRREVALALLTYQTPAAIVPVYPPDPRPEQQKPVTRPIVNRSHRATGSGEISFTTGELVAWFSARNRCEDILPPAEHGPLPRAFPTWREHGSKPNVVYYRKTNTWCDFGDGQAGGDALELYRLVSGREKNEILRELGREYRAWLAGGAICLKDQEA